MGVKLALMVTPERELLFFLNEKRLGVGTATTTEAVYGFIELHGLPGESVRLIPDLREVRKCK